MMNSIIWHRLDEIYVEFNQKKDDNVITLSTKFFSDFFFRNQLASFV